MIIERKGAVLSENRVRVGTFLCAVVAYPVLMRDAEYHRATRVSTKEALYLFLVTKYMYVLS
jgi:hypothetical protein